MEICKHCGFETADDIAVCPQCGKKAESEDNRYGLLSILLGILGGIGGLVLGVIGLQRYKSADNVSNCVIGICLFIVWAVTYIFLSVILIA